jgi:hypothetical protein
MRRRCLPARRHRKLLDFLLIMRFILSFSELIDLENLKPFSKRKLSK